MSHHNANNRPLPRSSNPHHSNNNYPRNNNQQSSSHNSSFQNSSSYNASTSSTPNSHTNNNDNVDPFPYCHDVEDYERITKIGQGINLF